MLVPPAKEPSDDNPLSKEPIPEDVLVPLPSRRDPRSGRLDVDVPEPRRPSSWRFGTLVGAPEMRGRIAMMREVWKCILICWLLEGRVLGGEW